MQTKAEQKRLPGIILNVMLAVVGFWLARLLASQWFVFDEWDYFDTTKSIFAPHNEHAVVFTKLWFRFLGRAGSQSYFIYALPLLVSHLLVVGLGYRMLVYARVDPWVALSSQLVVLCMGPGVGTLTWGGQFQYIGSVAAGVGAIWFAISGSKRLWLAVAIAVFGALNGSAYIAWAVSAGALLLWRRDYRAAAALAAPPVLWTVAVRLLWHPDTQFAARNLHQILTETPRFLFAIINNTIQQLLLVDGFTPVVIILSIAGVIATAKVLTSHNDDERSSLVGNLALVMLVFLVTVTLGRLSRGAEQVSGGGYSYLVLTILLPLCAVMLDLLVTSKGFLFRATLLATSLWLAATGLVTLRDNGVALSAWKRGGEVSFQTLEFMLQNGETFFDDQTPIPGTVPTLNIAALKDERWTRLVPAKDGGKDVQNQLSLNAQWRLQSWVSDPSTSTCTALAEPLVVESHAVVHLRPIGTTGVVKVTYPNEAGAREFTVTQPSSIETIAARRGVLVAQQGQFVVCKP